MSSTDVWIKVEPFLWPQQIKCLICLEETFEYNGVQDRERSVYENLINQKVEDEKIQVIFCSSCSRKLLDIDEFRALCHTSLKSYEKSIEKVKTEEALAPVATLENDVEDDEYKDDEDYKEDDEDDDFVDNTKENDDDDDDIPSATKRDYSKYYTRKIHYCSICKKTMTCFLGTHLKKRHMTEENGKLSCNLCSTVFKSQPVAMRHFKSNHLEFKEPRKCGKCGEFFKNAREYYRHREVERYHGKMECHHCGKKCSTRETIKSHIHVKHFGGKYCKYCNRTFIDAELLANHLVLEEEKRGKVEPKTFLCNICGAVFKRQRQLLVNHHARVHANAYNFPCEVCGKAFISKGLRNHHVKTAHGQEEVYCDICGKGFNSKLVLNTHIRRVHPKKSIECKICGKSYNPYSIQDHIKTHSDVRPHSCPYCPSKFKCRQALKKHLFSHSKTRPFNCLLCTAGYYGTSGLKDHYQRQHAITYTSEEVAKNCRREKPQFPEGFKDST